MLLGLATDTGSNCGLVPSFQTAARLWLIATPSCAFLKAVECCILGSCIWQPRAQANASSPLLKQDARERVVTGLMEQRATSCSGP